MRLKQLRDGPVGAAVVWAVILAITFAVGVVGQWLLFFQDRFPDWSALLRWPILWAVYFLIGHSLGEHVARHVATRLDL